MSKMHFKEDFSREGLSILKIIQLIRLFFPHNTRTLARLDKFSDLNLQKINKLRDLKIKGLIIDADDCIAFNHGEILPENIQHIKTLHEQNVKMVIYSNMKKNKRYEAIEEYAKVLTHIFPKPSKKGFKKALRELDLPAKNVAMVGDNYITDGGAIRLKIPFIKINPIGITKGNIIFGGALKLYGYLREFYDRISRSHDKLRKIKPLTSKDLK
ncbi:HAD family hydrolase [Candidatus Peregrinibacteria bacterium]|jgi:uncharacterized protein|nr:HAD family hydrolase [Candidatus Peregrinibacteria bacterium]MBT7736221.1 HAD family hydrolase [Candidatus Peregrinibacteria bacterium]